MKMIDLKRPKPEQTGIGQPAGIDEPYPYGLRIHLEQEELNKLGLDIDQ